MLIVVAIVGKLVGAMLAARFTGFGWRAAAVIGTLMNTRGLTELIVLNLALEKGVISEALFALLVIMALVTTFMAGPLLRLIDPRNEYGAPVEEEFDEARRESRGRVPGARGPGALDPGRPANRRRACEQLLALAEPLARSEPPRELILARLVRPPRGACRARRPPDREHAAQPRRLRRSTVARDELIAAGVAARAVAFVSPTRATTCPGWRRREDVDLVLIDGRGRCSARACRAATSGRCSREAPCDVAVLVAREGVQVAARRPQAPVIVPFGGAEHDWAALELGAWIASATGAPLKLLGAAGHTDEGDVTRLLADAGCSSSSTPASRPSRSSPTGRARHPRGGRGRRAARDRALRALAREGLGPTRSEIARAAPAPVLFVRRGVRPARSRPGPT